MVKTLGGGVSVSGRGVETCGQTYSLRLMKNKKFWVYYTNLFSHTGLQNGNLELFPVYRMESCNFPVYVTEHGHFSGLRKGNSNFPTYEMKPGNFSGI